MAIEKNSFKVSRVDSDYSPGSRDSMSTDEDEIQHRTSAVESDEDDDFDDADSGAGSDDFDLLELGETGAEFCQIGNQTCSIPFELYDLPNLEDVLSVDVWNECLSEEERLGLSKFLPDMDQETYMLTLMELFKGCNFHFDSPLAKLFDMLRGGFCEPRVALYREGLNSFEKRQHYHLLKKHQNQMVTNLCQIRDAWLNCRGYSIEEKLRVLNIVKSQKSLMCETEDMESDSSGREEFGERLWSKRVKERKLGQTMVPTSIYGVGLDLESSMALEPVKFVKQNSKGIPKIGLKMPPARQVVSGLPSLRNGSDLNHGAYGSVAMPHPSRAAGLGTGAALKLRDRMRGYDEVEDPIFGAGPRRDQVISRSILLDKPPYSKAGKKRQPLRTEEIYPDSFVGLPLSSKGDLHVYGRNRTSNQLFEGKMLTAKPPALKTSYEYSKKSLYPENSQSFLAEGQMMTGRGRMRQQQIKGNHDISDLSESFLHVRTEGETLSMDGQFQYDNWNSRSKKWKSETETSDLNLKPRRTSSLQVEDRLLTSDMKGSFSREKNRGASKKNGALNMTGLRRNKMIVNGDVTDSDSSGSFDDEESNPLIRSKLAYPSGFMEGARSFSKPVVNSNKGKTAKKSKKENACGFDGLTQSYRKVDDLGEIPFLAEEENYIPPKAKKKKKNKKNDSVSLQTSLVDMEGATADEDRIKSYKIGENGRLQVEPGENLHVPSLNARQTESKERGEVSPGEFIADEEDDSTEKLLLADVKKLKKQGKKGKKGETSGHNRPDRDDATISVRNSVTKKRKAKEEVVDMLDHHDDDSKLQGDLQQQINDNSVSKNGQKKKTEVDTRASDDEASDMPLIDTGVADMELEKPLKKAFTPITPTVHTGFSFSIVHLLSAVRMVMITHLPEDSFDVGKAMEHPNDNPDGGIDGTSSQKSIDGENSEHVADANVPSLTIQEIVDRVRLNPGDPCILETQEPLQDLVRGVLKILSSRTAPLGAKGWKQLVVYEKSRKGWSWVGPVSCNTSDQEIIEEVTSPEAWAIPHKMLVKLVDSFANWLKSGQETLQQIGSLPPPPLELMQFNADEKERFRDLRAQKSLSTINPSPEEVRAYFRKEEVLRYSIPDRAFSYTAADGKKSIVAPLRRCGGKPTSKARDHFMLKRDRPPHVTILCLVRDAAARLPGSIGTRADVCTLIRDSQYIVEDVSDTQVNQVVSGALDRLHYERDPCVQFDSERKLWKYLHREREEEDFEDDGTSSTKKWKRPKKDAADQSDQGAVTVAYHGTGEQGGFDLCSDLNMEPASLDDDKALDPVSEDFRLNEGDINNGSKPIGLHHEQTGVWDSFDLNPLQENKLLCQENSTNEDFDDDTFGRDRSVGILSAGLL